MRAEWTSHQFEKSLLDVLDELAKLVGLDGVDGGIEGRLTFAERIHIVETNRGALENGGVLVARRDRKWLAL